MTTPQAISPGLSQRRRLPRMQEFGLVVVILCLSLFLWLASGKVPVKDTDNNTLTSSNGTEVVENKFLRPSNIVPYVFTVMSWMAIMTIGETIVIISGGIDISVGSIMGLSAFLTAWILKGPRPPDGAPWPGYGWISQAPSFLHPLLMSHGGAVLLGASVAVGLGLLCGFINGALVVGLRMHPFIVTLSTLAIFRWIPLRTGVNLGNQMSMPGDGMLAPGFTDFIAWKTVFMTHGGKVRETYQFVPMTVMIICLILGWVYLRHTTWGRETYAVGGNEEASRYSGIRVGWVKMRVYILSGLCAGIAGMLSCGFYQAVQTSASEGYELNVIAAAVVGGAVLTGGRGTALGAVLGTLFITLIADGISVLGRVNLGFVSFAVTTLDTQLIYGVSIVLAVAIDRWTTEFYARQAARAGAARA